MACKDEYDELMSLRLDGLLPAEEERRLDEHLAACGDCAQLWGAMYEADQALYRSALQPLPASTALYASVMGRIATAAEAPAVAVASPLSAPQGARSFGTPLRGYGPLTRPLYDDVSVLLPSEQGEWQGRLAGYVRAASAAGFAAVGTALLLVALMLAGVVRVEGELASSVETARIFAGAVGTWLRSLFVGFGPGTVVAAALVLGLLALAGWQMVASYQRTVAEQRGQTGYLEAWT